MKLRLSTEYKQTLLIALGTNDDLLTKLRGYNL